MHVHTEFSCDSDADMNKYYGIARQKKMDAVCFTDHVDYNENDYGYGYYNPVGYFEKLNIIKNSKDVEVLSGIEFSEPHLYNEQLQKLTKYPYDFIIGSIHWIGDMFPCLEVREKYSANDFYSLYWYEVLKTVKNGGFDCLGHIDFPKRYYKELVYDETIILKIFSAIIEQNIVLEINTSSLRKGLSTTMPDVTLLKLYKRCGGKYVTIGSDSHVENDLGAGIDCALKLMQNMDLKQVVFRKRKMEVV